MIPTTPIPITSGIITLAALNLEHTKNFEMLRYLSIINNYESAPPPCVYVFECTHVEVRGQSQGVFPPDPSTLVLGTRSLTEPGGS